MEEAFGFACASAFRFAAAFRAFSCAIRTEGNSCLPLRTSAKARSIRSPADADGYGTIRELDRKIEMRALVEDARLKEEYGKSIIELAKKEKFDHELQFSPDFAAGKLNKADLELLHNYLHDLQGEKINRGLYVLGRSYTNAEAEETAKLMTVDMVAYDMFKADVEAGKVDRKKRSDSFFYHNNRHT